MSNPWTPGPWFALPYKGDDSNFDINSATIYVAESLSGVPFEEEAANARLLAAAPEMAEVLKKTERHMVSFYRASSPAGNVGNENAFADNDAIIIEIRNLLSRIRGDQS